MHAADEDVAARCSWATGDLLRRTHDEEWWLPVHRYDRRSSSSSRSREQGGPELADVLKRGTATAGFAGFDRRWWAAFDVARLDTLVQDLASSGTGQDRVDVTNARAVLAVARSSHRSRLRLGFLGDEVIP